MCCNQFFLLLRKYLIVFLFFLHSPSGFTQYNLIPNPSFENYSNCPPGKVNLAYPWQLTTNSSSMQPEYNNVCSTNPCCGVPNNISGYGYQLPRSGNAYIGLYFMYVMGSNLRSYIQVKLKDSLKAGKCFYAEFYVNLENVANFSINNIAMLFTENSVSQGVTGGVIAANPQIVNYGNPISPIDTVNWYKISGIIQGTGKEQYITIGNFKTDAQTDTLNTNFPVAFKYGGYYIDDVSVIPIDSMLFKADAGPDVNVTTGDSVFVGTLLGGTLTTTWYNSSGQVIANNVPGIYVQPTQNTFYILEQNVCGSISRDTVTVTVQPFPLKLTHFTASVLSSSLASGEGRGEVAILKWQTQSEQNTSNFIIQRSSNASNFESIGKVKAAGNSHVVKDYSYVDDKVFSSPLSSGVLPEMWFYRLLMIDKDGRFTYSPIREIKFRQNDESKIYPNPTKNKIYVVGNGIIELTLLDNTRRKIISKTLKSSNNPNLDISKTQRGIYLLMIKSVGGKTETRKLIVE